MIAFLTPQVWDTLIWLTVGVGGLLALWRLRMDLLRSPTDDDARREGGERSSTGGRA